MKFVLLILIIVILFIYFKFSKKESFSFKLIPDVIHKIYITEDNQAIPDNIQNAINTWKTLNPGYTLKIWNNDDCLNYLKNNFSEDHVNCFNGFIPYAYKADFFRYCVIYNEGGWYSDIQQVLLVPLNKINDKNYEWVSCYDETGLENKLKKCIQNSFFGSIKGSILLEKTIEECIKNYKNKIYTDSPWDVSGPCLLGNVFKTLNISNVNIGFTFNDPKDGPCFNINGKKVIINKCCTSIDVPGSAFKKGNNYISLWKNKNVFKSNFTSVSINNDICILLTMCVNVKAGYAYSAKDRLELYLKVVQRWLDNTTFDIYIVESSGYPFLEFNGNPRIKIYSFVSKSIFNCRGCSATPYEAESILLAYSALNLSRYPKFLKVTGKYYLPGIESLVKDIPEDAQLYFQYRESYSQQNSEFFGCQSKLVPLIMNLILENSYKNMNFESTLYSIRNKFVIYRFPKIKLDQFTKRGDNTVLKYL
jgi:hypothetical protein